jgi:DNA-binding CsgD family transcriptional regulator/tetratricopeptide (TPR) repeat protein
MLLGSAVRTGRVATPGSVPSKRTYMDLLERGSILLELSHRFHEAGSGTGRLVFLAGEAGVGKTALVRRFGTLVETKSRILIGACDPLSTPRPLGPLRDICGKLGQRWIDMVEHPTKGDTLFHRFLVELSGGTHPTLVIFEDVHWADEATLDLLRFLARRIEDSTALLIATYREHEIASAHPLRVVLGDLATCAGVDRLSLGPLSEASVRAMAEGSPVDAAELHRRTGGNPFYVTEVLAAGGDGVPGTIRDAVLARAARLSTAARHALQAAAVIGPRIEPSLLEALSGSGPDAIDACLSSGMLHPQADALAFRHDLAREAILSSLPPHRRRALHRGVLDALLASTTPSDPARLAHHAEAAGDAAAVLRHAPEAARAAARLSSHREAAAQYARALRFADALSARERARLLDSQSYEHYLTDQIPDAIAAREVSLGIWSSEGDALRQGDSLRWLSRLHWFTGDRSRAEEMGRAALDVLEQHPRTSELAMALSNWAQLHMLAQRREDAVVWGERAIALAESLGDSETLSHALNNVGTARLHRGDSGGSDQLERSLELALEAGLEEHAARAYTNLGSVLTATYQFTPADHFLERGIHYCTERDLDSWRLYMLSWQAVSRMRQGHWDEANAVAEEVLRHPRVSPVSRVQALHVSGRIAALRGDPGGWARLDEALEVASPTGEIQRLAPVRAARAEVAWASADVDRSRAEAEAVLDLAVEQRDPWLAGELGYWSFRTGGTRKLPDWSALPFKLQIADRWLEAADEWKRIGCPFEAACALSESNDPAAVHQALAVFEELTARVHVKIARRRLRTLGVRRIPRGPRPETRGNAGQLTRRELEVLHFLVEGRRDAEIARTMYLSPRTVGHHVSSILSKLGVSTRTEAAHEAMKLGITKSR